MRLNTLSPAPGAKTAPKRVGRGIGSGLGKTCGRGHKGQRARKSGNVRAPFEGGQMPLQKRLPKYGFTSRVSLFAAEVRLMELNSVDAPVIDMEALRSANVIGHNVKTVKIFLSGEIKKPVTVKGLLVSKGARAAIETAGGKIED